MKHIYLLALSIFIYTSSTAQTPPTNDDCANAIELLADTSCVSQAFSTEGATESLDDSFLCSGNPDDEVWFRFTATSERMQIEATGVDASFNANIQYFSASGCSDMDENEFACADAASAGETEVLLMENLIIGQVYYFRVFERGSIANQTHFIFEVCVIELDIIPFVANDFPCTALLDTFLIPVDGSIGYYDNSFNTIDDNEFLITPDNGTCDDYDYSGWCSDDGIQNSAWFAFVAPASGAVNIDVCNDGQTEILTQLALYSFDDCTNFATYSFEAGNEVSPDCTMGSQLSTCALNPGEIYLVLVDGYQLATGVFTFSISEVHDPYAGVDIAVDVCKNTPDFDLFAQLPGADSTGFWIDADSTGNLINGNFNATNTDAGTYDFIYVVEGFSCFSNDSATVTVTTQPLPNAGEDGVYLACSGAAEIDLFTVLEGTPETGGIWYDPDGNISDGLFEAGVDLAGPYLYVISSGDLACPQDSSFSTVFTIITTGTDPGDDATISVCTNSPSFNMTEQLGGTPDDNGLWFDSNSIEVDEIFDPATQPGGNYFYIVSAAGCGSDYAILTISITTGPSAGMDADSILCFNNMSVDLWGILNGTPDAGGTWTDPDGNTSDGTFDPATDVEGIYWYFVTAAGCEEDSASVTMVIDIMADAGTNSTAWTCYDAGEFFLITLLNGTPQEGGEWTDPNGDSFDGFFNPTADPEGEYAYTINGACDTASAIVTVNVDIEPHAGTGPSEQDTLDVLEGSVDLWDYLSDVPEPSGNWVDLDNSGGLSGSIFTPDAGMAGSNYVFAYVVNNVCGTDTAFVDVFVKNTTGIDDYSSISFSIYPNPAIDHIMIDSKGLAGDFLVEIRSQLGQLIYTKNIQLSKGNKQKVNLDLPKGYYVLSLVQKNKIVYNKKLILQ